jgi:hypothetical protein
MTTHMTNSSPTLTNASKSSSTTLDCADLLSALLIDGVFTGIGGDDGFLAITYDTAIACAHTTRIVCVHHTNHKSATDIIHGGVSAGFAVAVFTVIAGGRATLVGRGADFGGDDESLVSGDDLFSSRGSSTTLALIVSVAYACDVSERVHMRCMIHDSPASVFSMCLSTTIDYA